MPYVVDNTRWPLVSVEWQGTVSNDEFHAYLRDMDANLERTTRAGTSTALRFDARKSMPSNSVQRKLQADWIKANEAGCKRHCVGFAFVLDNAVMRGALTAILWLAPLPAPHIVCATAAEADRWLIARLQEAGVRVPGGLAIGA